MPGVLFHGGRIWLTRTKGAGVIISAAMCPVRSKVPLVSGEMSIDATDIVLVTQTRVQSFTEVMDRN